MSDYSRISAYLFAVEIDGIETARFQKCEGLEAETEVFEYEEGGGGVLHFKGRSHYPNIVLERGINENDVLFKWYKQCTEGKIERKTGSVVLYDLAENEIRRWDFYNALPCRWIGPRLDAHDPRTFAVERIEIAHEGFFAEPLKSEPYEREKKKVEEKETRNRIGNPVQPMNKTFDMALNPELYAECVAKKYGINLKGSGQKISIKYNPELVAAGKTRKVNPKVIEIGPSALVSEEELANTIAHELNHARSFLKGGPAPEWGVGGAYPAGNSLAKYIRGEI